MPRPGVHHPGLLRRDAAGEVTAAPMTEARRARLHGRVRVIAGVTIAWNVLEAVVALVAGALASSAALVGFGLDSVIEVASAAAIAWQFTRREPERWETTTVRAIGIAFFALAAYVSVDAILDLAGVREAERSPAGIGITVASLVVMPALAWVELRSGRELASRSVRADAKQLLLCVYLSGTVLVGLLLTALLGWSWADPVAALVVAALAVREGVEAWRGDVESPFEARRGLEALEDAAERDSPADPHGA